LLPCCPGAIWEEEEEEEEEEKKKKDGIWSHQIERGDNGAKEEWRRR